MKLTTSDLASLTNEASALSTINNNNALIEAALENTLSRDGTSPNTMTASLDMNSQRIINLPTPGSDNDAARKIDIDNAILGDYSGQIINGTANQITASTVGTTTTLSLPNALTFTGKTVTGGTFSSPTITGGTQSSPAITTPNIIGTTAVGNAAAGSVGELLTGSGNQALVTATSKDICTISLTPGDWDLYFQGLFAGAGATITTDVRLGINTVSNTLPAQSPGLYFQFRNSAGLTDFVYMPTVGPLRVNISATTTYYGVAQATFTVSTFSCQGLLRARRIR
jgi:hypothetical protein